MVDCGPSLHDIIHCTHYDLKGKDWREFLCECVTGEVGWSDKSGNWAKLGEYTNSTKDNPTTFVTKTRRRQLKLVHTTRWENKHDLKTRFGNKARSSLRISENVLDLLNRQTGRAGRVPRKHFAEGLPACGNTHRMRRQIFVLLHTDSEYLLNLLYSYSLNSEYKKKIDSVRGKKKKNIVTYLPVLERATDELIDSIVKRVPIHQTLSFTEKKLKLLEHSLLKDKSKWRYTLCRLIELGVIHRKLNLVFPEEKESENISDIYSDLEDEVWDELKSDEDILVADEYYDDENEEDEWLV